MDNGTGRMPFPFPAFCFNSAGTSPAAVSSGTGLWRSSFHHGVGGKKLFELPLRLNRKELAALGSGAQAEAPSLRARSQCANQRR